MDQFNLNNFNNYPPPNLNKGGSPPNAPSNVPNNAPESPDMKFLSTKDTLQNIMQKSVSQSALLNNLNSPMLSNLKMNNLANLERGLYIKDLMNLPKDLEEVLVLIQNKMATNEEVTTLLTKSINMTTLAELIQTGGKEALNKLVLVMANASKQGITDLSQIKDTIRLINASVSVAGQDNPSQILKSFILLYLPWLPLQEGVDFDLEIEGSEGGEDGSETSITILISTKNYGNVRVTIVLLEGNSMSIIINCCEKFPKEELLKRIKTESKAHSIPAEISFEQKETKKDAEQDKDANVQAKISMSNLTKVNPFLLLMANAVIRHTIELDNQIG